MLDALAGPVRPATDVVDRARQTVAALPDGGALNDEDLQLSLLVLQELAYDGIDGAERFEDVLGDRSGEVGSLGFLDFSQLLELGEQTGLNDSRAYLAARDDLQKVRAVGVNSSGSEEETTAEILLSIP